MVEWCKTFYDKKISTRLIRVLKKTGITPNKVTILNHCITLTCGVYCFSRGTWIGNIGGLCVMLFIGIMDYADGDLARSTNKYSQLGKWLDSVFDVIIQSAVMASIAVGCHKNGLPFYIIAWFFVGNAATNLVSFHYNNTFGFNSYDGSDIFRKYMEEKPTIINRFFKNLIDPTSSPIGLGFFTVRYWLTIGCIFNLMMPVFVAITIIGNFRWIIMYVLYAMHLHEYKKLWVSQALAIIDKEREEFYAL